jgi:hypothetical protein
MSVLLNATITAAQSAAEQGARLQLNGGARNLTLQANFTYGSSGTTVKAYVQTSIDNGLTWCDIACFAFATTTARKIFNLSGATPVTTQATPSDGSLTDNTSVDGILGPLFRVKTVTTGTYGGSTTLRIDATGIDLPGY